MHRLPPPKGDAKAALKALLVDSWYDAYLGVVVLVRVVDGVLHKGQRIRLMSTGAVVPGRARRHLPPKQEMLDMLGPGEVGFFTAAIKEVADTRVGDTVTEEEAASRPSRCRVSSRRSRWCSAACFRWMRPSSKNCARRWRKLRLNDASFTYEMETTAALGFGFRCGFLGLLHLEIVRERLEREFNIDLIATAPERHLSRAHDRRQHEGAAQPGRHARHGEDRQDRGAVDRGDHSGARRVPGRGAEALRGPARAADRSHLCRHPRHGRLRVAAERGGVRFLRPAEVGLAAAMPVSTTTSSATRKAIW